MTDLDDDALAARLRDGFDALAHEVGGAPPELPAELPATTRRPSSGPRRTALVAAVVIVVVAAGGLGWSLRDRETPDSKVTTDTTLDPAPVTDEPVSDRPLVDTRWWMVRAERDGEPVDLGGRHDIGLRLTDTSSCEDASDGQDCPWTGPTLRASDACNGVSGPFALPTAGSIELGPERGPTTAMGCGGPLVELIQEVVQTGTIDYEVTGDQLVLARGTARLTYEASDGPFAPTSGTVVDEGTVDGQSYRLVWAGGGLDLQVADADGVAIGGTGLGEGPGRINPTRSDVAGRAYLLAIVPVASARVVYEPVGGAPQDLPVHRVDSTTSSVVGAFVDDAPSTWQVVAYDTDGLELHRYRWGARADGGAGISIEEVVTAAGLQDCCTPAGARESFTADGTPMSIGSSPIEPTAPPSPEDGLVDPARTEVPGGGTAMTGTIRDEAALRFDCGPVRYEVRAPLDAGDALLEVAPALSAAAGCPSVAIADQ